MNIYEKLQAARIKIAAGGIQKSGKNEFAKYKYYGLGDFLPQIMEACDELKITPIISTDSEGRKFVLELINSESPEEVIRFSIPIVQAQLKGVQPIQNLGAVITYSRRYLYMLAFEIIETDVIEESTGMQERTFKLDSTKSPREELERFWKFVGYDVDRLDEYLDKQSMKRGVPIDDDLITSVLNAQIDYVTREAQKINSQFSDVKIES
ncbi:MAG: ERF family protein [Selenomonadaceae bacterium]|nr:ERF family protein [Selenomonadaceae bacterium]